MVILQMVENTGVSFFCLLSDRGAARHDASDLCSPTTLPSLLLLCFAGFHAPHVDPFHKNMATIIGATMWFWIFLRFKEDGGVLLVRGACLCSC